MKTSKDFLSVNDFSNEIGAHPNSIRKMIKTGRLSAFRIGGGKKSSYRIPKSEIQRLAEMNLQDVVDDLANNKVKEILERE